MKYRIANFNIELINITEKKTLSQLENYSYNDFDKADLTIKYAENDNIILDKNSFIGPYKGWYFKNNSDEGYEFAKFAAGVENAISHVKFDRKSSVAFFANWNITELIGVELFYSVFYTLSDIYSFFVLDHNSVIFHSSTIDYNGMGLCFSGKSGTGKSTHTSLWKKYCNASVINDDTPTIRITKDDAYVCGTPFAGSTGININKILPLKGIFFLEQAKENSTERLSAADAMKRFFDETKKPIFKSSVADIMSFFAELYNKVPIYLLRCNMEKDAVETVKKTLNLR